MLKSVILCIFLWHGMCEFSSRAHPASTNPQILNFPVHISGENNDTDMQTQPKVNYYFNITIYNINAPLFGTTASRTAATTAASTTASTAAISCGAQIRPREDYVKTSGFGAHKLHTEALCSWTEARQICIAEGGDLAVIRSYWEEKIVQELVRNSDEHENLWIGFHRENGTGEWISVFNETLSQNGWENWSYSDLRTQPYKCVEYNANIWTEGMIPNDCDVPQKFICKLTNY